MADDFLSDEDKALFRESMRSVKPLNEKTKRVNTKKPKTPIPPKKHIPKETTKKRIFLIRYDRGYLFFPKPSYPMLSQAFLQTIQSIKNRDEFHGNPLDLHGLKSEKARDAFVTLLKLKQNMAKDAF